MKGGWLRLEHCGGTIQLLNAYTNNLPKTRVKRKQVPSHVSPPLRVVSSIKVWGFSKRNGKKIVVGTHVIIVERSARVVRSNRFLLLSSLDVDGPFITT
jgi:hypothetical protein